MFYPCARCNKPVRRSPSQVRGAAYCSRDCANHARTCPFTPEQLRNLYVKAQVGCEQIALMASGMEGWDPPATSKVARRWLQEAGIAVRSIQEHNENLAEAGVAAHNLERAREVLQEKRAEGLVTSHGQQLHTPEVRKKVGEALTRWERRKCEACGQWVVRKPSEFEKHVYCSKSCAASVNNCRTRKRRALSRARRAAALYGELGTLEAVGRVLGVSRQAVSVLVRRVGVKPTLRRREKSPRLCVACGQVLNGTYSRKLCRACAGDTATLYRYHYRQETARNRRECAQCGSVFFRKDTRPSSSSPRQNWYCSRACDYAARRGRTRSHD